MKCNNIFNQDDLLDIEKEVASIERVTSGEIVPVIANRSSKYRTAEIIAAIIFGYIFVFAASEINKSVFWNNSLSIFQFILIDFTGIILAFLLFRIAVIKRLIISKRAMIHKVHDAAFSTFYQQGVHKTKNKTGILIYISLFERKVVVLGDEGIHAKVKDSDWNDVINIIVKGINDEHLKKGIIDGIESCRKLLQTHFPVLADDINELDNRLIIIKN
ncbi:MAG: TPM domain-containing protein [Proteobacteria bacterium]|nr:TPM domain-containing protein [Pseudomonadota bacterium]